MRAGKAGLSSIVGLALLMTPAVSRAGDVKVEVEIVGLKMKEPTLYDCGTKAPLEKQTLKKENLPAKALASKPSDGWLRVTLPGQKDYKCVEDWRVVTNQPETIKAECGSVVAQRSAGTRGVGEACEPKGTSKPKH